MTANDLMRRALLQTRKNADDPDAELIKPHDVMALHSSNLAYSAAAAIQTWVEDDVPLDKGETYGNRLLALLVGIVDEDKNGELDDTEQEEFDEVRDYAQQYLERLGVDSDDAFALLDDWEEDQALNIRDLVAAHLPDDDEALNDIASFVHGDLMALDSAKNPRKPLSRPKVVFVHGRKTFKRSVIGRVVLTPKQKAALAKGRKKSHSAMAQRNREKSLKARNKAGL